MFRQPLSAYEEETMESKEKRRKEGLLEKASVLLDLPGDTVAGLPCLELIGDRELRMENYRGILSCSKEEIHVDGGKWVLRIQGQDLEIRAMRERELLITGWLDRIELM
jgi:sporulation protein YqfC